MINDETYKIQKNIPIPKDEMERMATNKKGRLPKYNFDKMMVSDSICVSSEYNARDRRNANDAADQFTLKNKLDWKFRAGRCPNSPDDITQGFHTRIWRVK